MSKRIPDEIRQEISRLYNNGKGLSPTEIARQTGVSYFSVYGMTRARQRINPDTGNPFESLTQYHEHLARQRINPDTGKKFKSLSERQDYLARQRINKNKELSDLISSRLKELGQNQSWLAEQLGVSRQAVSL